MADNEQKWYDLLNENEKEYVAEIFSVETNGELPDDIKNISKEDFWKYLLFHLKENHPLGSFEDNTFAKEVGQLIDYEMDNEKRMSWNNSVQNLIEDWNNILKEVGKYLVDENGKISKDGEVLNFTKITQDLMIYFAKIGNAAYKKDTIPYVAPPQNLKGKTYLETRGEDLIESAANIEGKEVQETNAPTLNEQGIQEKVDFWLNLLMPKYKREVEVEDLNKNFWVISQVLSALSWYLFDDDGFGKKLRDMIDELIQLWDNILMLWTALAKNLQTKEDDGIFFEVLYLNQPNSYSSTMKFDNFVGQYFKIEKMDDESESYQIVIDKKSIIEECKKVINPEKNKVVIPVIRSGNYKRNYYNCEYWPGVVIYNAGKRAFAFSDFLVSEDSDLNFVQSIYKVKEEEYSYGENGELNYIFNKGIFIDLKAPTLQEQVIGMHENEFDYDYIEKLANTRLRKGDPVYYGLIRTILDISQEFIDEKECYSFSLRLIDIVKEDLEEEQILLNNKPLTSISISKEELLTEWTVDQVNKGPNIYFKIDKIEEIEHQDDNEDLEEESSNITIDRFKIVVYSRNNVEDQWEEAVPLDTVSERSALEIWTKNILLEPDAYSINDFLEAFEEEFGEIGEDKQIKIETRGASIATSTHNYPRHPLFGELSGPLDARITEIDLTQGSYNFVSDSDTNIIKTFCYEGDNGFISPQNLKVLALNQGWDFGLQHVLKSSDACIKEVALDIDLKSLPELSLDKFILEANEQVIDTIPGKVIYGDFFKIIYYKSHENNLIKPFINTKEFVLKGKCNLDKNFITLSPILSKIDLSQWYGYVRDESFYNNPNLNRIIMPTEETLKKMSWIKSITFGKRIFDYDDQLDYIDLNNYQISDTPLNTERGVISEIKLNDYITIDKDFFGTNRQYEKITIEINSLSKKDMYKSFFEDLGIQSSIQYKVKNDSFLKNKEGNIGYYQGEIISNWKYVIQEKYPVNTNSSYGLHFLLDKEVLDQKTISENTYWPSWFNVDTSGEYYGWSSENTTGVSTGGSFMPSNFFSLLEENNYPNQLYFDYIGDFLSELKNCDDFKDIYTSYFKKDSGYIGLMDAIALYNGAHEALGYITDDQDAGTQNAWFLRIYLHNENGKNYWPVINNNQLKGIEVSNVGQSSETYYSLANNTYTFIVGPPSVITTANNVNFNFTYSNQKLVFSSDLETEEEWKQKAYKIIFISILIIVGQSFKLNFYNFIPINGQNMDSIDLEPYSSEVGFIIKNGNTLNASERIDIEKEAFSIGENNKKIDERADFINTRPFSYFELLKDREHQLLRLDSYENNVDVKKTFQCYSLMHFQDGLAVDFGYIEGNAYKDRSYSIDADGRPVKIPLPKKVLIFFNFNDFEDIKSIEFKQDGEGKYIEVIFKNDTSVDLENIRFWKSHSDEDTEEINESPIKKIISNKTVKLYFDFKEKETISLKMVMNDNVYETKKFVVKNRGDEGLELMYEQGGLFLFPFQRHGGNFDKKGLIIKTPLGQTLQFDNAGLVKTDINSRGLASAWYSGHDGHSCPHPFEDLKGFESARIFIDERDYELSENNWILENISYDSYDLGEAKIDFSYPALIPNGQGQYDNSGFLRFRSGENNQSLIDVYPLVEFYYDLSTDLTPGVISLKDLLGAEDIGSLLINLQKGKDNSENPPYYFSDNNIQELNRRRFSGWKRKDIDKVGNAAYSNWMIQKFTYEGTIKYYQAWADYINTNYYFNAEDEKYYLKENFLINSNIKIPWPLIDEKGDQVIGRLGMLTQININLTAAPKYSGDKAEFCQYDFYKFDAQLKNNNGEYDKINNRGYADSGKVNKQFKDMTTLEDSNNVIEENIYERGQWIPAYYPKNLDDSSFSIKNKKEYQGNKYILFSQSSHMIKEGQYSYDFASYPSNGKYERYIPHWGKDGNNQEKIDGLVSEKAHLPLEFLGENILNNDDYGELLWPFQLTFKDIFPDASYYTSSGNNKFYINGDRNLDYTMSGD